MKILNVRKVQQVLVGMVLLSFFYLPAKMKAQTPGVIYDRATSTAGRLVLDRNADGYSSATTAGYTSNDVTQSEMIFTPIPQVSVEPNGDVVTAPNCGFTDFTDNSITRDAVGVHLDSNGTYLVFRFRMSNTSSNSKGYSILIDADGKFGNTGPYADPNYVAPTSSSFGNPGFEIEVLLATNFGVYVYNVDGTANPGAATTTYAGHTNYQKSVAYNTNCTAAYFLDFYVKVADLPSPYNNINTGFRYTANTVTSPHSALQGPISDMGGIDDAAFGHNITSMWTNLVTAQSSTTLANVTNMTSKLQPPTVLSPIYNSATSIKIINNDLAAGYLTVYKSHLGVTSLLGVTSNTASGATGTLSSVSVATGDLIWATDSALNATVSLKSNIVTVIAGSACTRATAPVVSCITNRGMSGTSLYSGATIKVYTNTGTLYQTFTGGTTLSGGTYTWAFNPSGGSSSTPCTSGPVAANTTFGSYLVTVTASGGSPCESAVTPSGSRTQSGGSASPCTPPSAPTVSVCNSSTGVISGTASVASDSILIIKNGSVFTSVKASSTAWSYTGTFQSTDTILVAEFTAGGCMSSFVLGVTPPVVSSPIYNGATSVSGTSIAPSGSTIEVFKGGVSVGITTVNASGNWTKSNLSALATGNAITAKVVMQGYYSGISNTVTVIGAATAVTPTITGSYTENGQTVSGSLPASTPAGTINLYADGTLIGSVSTALNSTTWTVSGLSNTSTASLDNYLYAGSQLTAKFTPNLGTEGAASNTVIVGCTIALINKTITASKYRFCSSEYPTVTIANSEAGIIYTMVNNGTSTTISPSAVGTGGTITLTASSTLSTSKIVQVTAQKISSVACATTETDTAYLREDCSAVYVPTTYASGHTYSNNDVLATVTDADGTITAAVLNTGTLPPGTTLNPATGNIYISNITAFAAGGAGSWPMSVNTTDSHTYPNQSGSAVSGTSTPALTLTYSSALPVTLVRFEGKIKGEVIDLDWETAQEINNDRFEIERSINGIDFEKIGTTPGHGNASTPLYYAFTDENPIYGTSYYRLKQVDFNGKYEYSQMISFNMKGKDNTQMNVYPNPVMKTATLHVELSTTKNEIVTISLVDIAGRTILQNSPVAVAGITVTDLNIQGVKQGFYFIRAQTTNKVIERKLQILE